jgi:Gamma-glutamyl cyclotransferase, AIG2-like
MRLEMQSRPIDVFFYGLFMDAERLRARGFHPVNERQACVSGMALRIGRRATLVPDPSKCVYGFVFGLSHQDIERLYAEPSVAAYRPEAVIAQLADRSCVAALCFNLPSSGEIEEANPEYAEKLRIVGRRLGLPADYTASIR